MSLTYSCPNCHKKYEATIMGSRFTYLCSISANNNKVLTLTHADEDCFTCQDEIKQAEQTTRTRIRQQTTP